MPKNSFRPIREAAAQFLYCLHLEGEEAPQASVDSPFWQTLLENDEEKLAKAKTTAILFISQGRATRLEKLKNHGDKLVDALRTDDKSEALRNQIEALITQESKLTSALTSLEKDSKQIKYSESINLNSAIEAVFKTDAVSVVARQSIERDLCDFPAARNLSEPFLAAAKRLQRISERYQAIQNPRQFSDDNSIKHLAADEERLDEIRTGATKMASGVLENLSSIDNSIAEVVENFDPSRLNPVDRAILRLGTWEILFLEETPNNLAINEAVAIAKRLSTNSSASFVNGILDAIHKSNQHQ